ncbi:TPA: hypothetical protein DEO28_00805 [Candidatus Dependentiae bacterium]|nr:MAG: Protein TolR [candidate division TM6 bacterium GW2011_GWE2_31_21]KKP54133.1 MAG: Protein TolR [candidate division TM6 bacterium GW2011_GWF2_33_332]HBS47854.1 hypothetical protein [Candidatus Dependentiae bacterium]HBZ73039.1 hypothetical protein [Candidatus Dependentiae bacterium]
MFKRQKRKIKPISIPEIMLTPLIDTALTLLIIFIVTAPMVQNNVKVDLPFGKSREASHQQEYIVSITKNHELFFNSNPVKKAELTNMVREALGGNVDTPVYVEADKALSYGQVVSLIDELKGVTKVVVLSTKSAV